MKIVTIITATLLSFAVNAAQQATIQYCDNNREQAVQEAFGQIDYVLPDKISDYMKEHAIPTFVTNKETIIIQTNYVTNTDHFETNYTHEIITRDINYNTYSNYYHNTYVSTNHYSETGFLVSPDFQKALSGDLQIYEVQNDNYYEKIETIYVWRKLRNELANKTYIYHSMDINAAGNGYVYYMNEANPQTPYTPQHKIVDGVVIRQVGQSPTSSSFYMYNTNGSQIASKTIDRRLFNNGTVYSFDAYNDLKVIRHNSFAPTGKYLLGDKDITKIYSEPPTNGTRYVNVTYTWYEDGETGSVTYDIFDTNKTETSSYTRYNGIKVSGSASKTIYYQVMKTGTYAGLGYYYCDGHQFPIGVYYDGSVIFPMQDGETIESQGSDSRYRWSLTRNSGGSIPLDNDVQTINGDLTVRNLHGEVVDKILTTNSLGSVEQTIDKLNVLLANFNPNKIMSRDCVSYISGDLTVFTGVVALVITNGVSARYIKSDDGTIYEWDQNNTDGGQSTTGGYNVYKNLNYPNDEFYSRNLDNSHQSDYPHYEHGLTWYVDVNNYYRQYMIFSSQTDYVKTRVSKSNANEVRFDTGSELFFIDAEVDKANTHYWEHSAVATVRNGGMTFNPTGFSSNMVAYVSINQMDTSHPDTNPSYTYGARTLKIIGDDVLGTGTDENENEYIDYGFSGGSVGMFTRDNFKLRYFPRTGRWTIVSSNTNIKVIALVDGKSDSIYFFPNYVKIKATRTSTSAYDQVYELFLYRWLSTGIEYK